MNRLLIVEDDEALAELLASDLGERGYRVDAAADRAAALHALEKFVPDLVLSDLRLPDGSGLDVLEAAQRHLACPAVILITAFGTVPQAVEALKAGADDFLTKPLDLEHLAVRVERTLGQRRASAMLAELRETLGEPGDEALFHGMVGRGAVMQQLFATIRRVARVDAAVPARSASHGRSTRKASGVTVRSFRSTVRACPRRCSKPSSSVIRPRPSQGRVRSAGG